MIALVDCNNFYVSCERLFAPELRNKPVVVLSNNDGCVIARSDEAKEMGIKMGIPVFEIKSLVQSGKLQVFSSNYVLYGDISNRVVQILSQFSNEIEVYSIDESFINLRGITDLPSYASQIRTKIKQCTGIPTCVGVASTKTLAKIANRYAKKHHKEMGVWILDTPEKIEQALKATSIEDVWGIGRRYAKLLEAHHIHTAFDFIQANEHWVRAKMTIVGQRLLYELRGISCLSMELINEPKKNICTSRSFGTMLTQYNPLSEAVSNFAAACAFKLRKQKSVANYVQVFVTTNPFAKNEKQYFNSVTITLPVADSDSRVIIKNALLGFSKIYKEGYKYKKAGIIVSGIIPEDQYQLALFAHPDSKTKKLMAVLDSINHSNGKNKLRLAAQGFDRTWKLKNERLSQKYTTRFDELLIIKI
ncbi:Y-family DNA polymerase [Cellulophaga sp. BC115SP]|uniref:Y-family DNA polymerase n=1 Tax=Cellulophaga sp. BC115SP TaxID=2683263 RepID=UPI001412052A|nr:Y-family DNA polymerase [Cellulophaga sp. BC115SP]NBB31644.1 DUF4113 domain-containing protein [Cellulophaga sp. BC115SP]